MRRRTLSVLSLVLCTFGSDDSNRHESGHFEPSEGTSDKRFQCRPFAYPPLCSLAIAARTAACGESMEPSWRTAVTRPSTDQA